MNDKTDNVDLYSGLFCQPLREVFVTHLVSRLCVAHLRTACPRESCCEQDNEPSGSQKPSNFLIS